MEGRATLSDRLRNFGPVTSPGTVVKYLSEGRHNIVSHESSLKGASVTTTVAIIATNRSRKTLLSVPPRYQRESDENLCEPIEAFRNIKELQLGKKATGA